MNCPFCKHENTRVVDSRDTNDGKVIRRRRECEQCKSRFSTYEEVELLNVMVIKRNGEKMFYDKNKIRAGIMKALEKRPITPEKIAKLLGTIEYDVQQLEKPEVTSKDIGKIVMTNLKNLDEVAYVRFASVYKSFGSIESFKKELDRLDRE